MKTVILVIACAFGQIPAFAQSTLTGKVTNADGEPLPLANVLLESTYEGASTDAEGNFSFTTSQTGQKILQVSYTGLLTYRQEVVLEGSYISLVIQLKEDVKSLAEVTINAGSFTAGGESEGKLFRAIDIATTAGATADIAGALNTLPGAQKVGESGRLFIRGGDGNEVQTYIDGLLVADAYSPAAPNSPSRGRFLPFMFQGISFSTGGYSAEYGQALSSTLVLDSKDKSTLSRTDLGILSVGADAGHTQAWNRGSIGGKFEYTNLRPYFCLLKQNLDWKEPPVATVGHIAFKHESGKKGLVKAYGNFSDTQFMILNHGIGDNNAEILNLANKFRYINASYKNNLNERWLLSGGFSFTHNRTKTSENATTTFQDEKVIHAKIVADRMLWDNAELKTGSEIVRVSYLKESSDGSPLALQETISSIFTETNLFFGSRFVSRGGVRVEYNSLTNSISIDPRFSVAYKAGSESQVSFAFGKFRQSPKPEFTALHGRHLQSERALHYILNYQHREDNRTFRIETYYKKYTNLIKLNNDFAQPADNSGYGFARGVELFWRDNRTFENTDYWISYSFLDTKRNYLDFPCEAVPAFASAHNLSVVFKYFIKDLKSQLGTTYSFASGRSYHNPNITTFNGATTPSFHDLSLNWSYLPTSFLIVYLSCTNVLGRDNIFGYEYSDRPGDQGTFASRPIRQPAKHFLFAGIFITISKEKSINQLPNL